MNAHQHFEELASRAQRQNESIGPAFWIFAAGTTLAIGASITWLLTRPEAHPQPQPEAAVVAEAEAELESRTPMERHNALRRRGPTTAAMEPSPRAEN
jgi:hypothetical protein